jgi:phosphatidylglycerol---prolipoprotein diacylglyceryl transferase
MNGIIIDIDPVLFWIGPLALTWHGLFSALAIVVGFTLTLPEARRRGLDEDKIYTLGLWAVFSALVGARLAHVVDHWGYYAANPLSILAFTSGGLSIYGGLLGGFIAGGLYAWRARVPIRQVADAAAPALILAQAVGRIGCAINGDVHGAPANLPWAFAYVHPGALAPELGVPGHPYPIYEIIWNLIIFGLLWRMRHRVQATPGVLFLVYAIFYALGRIFLSVVREEAVVLAGLQQAQVIGVGLLLLAVPALLFLLWPRRARVDGEQHA